MMFNKNKVFSSYDFANKKSKSILKILIKLLKISTTINYDLNLADYLTII